MKRHYNRENDLKRNASGAIDMTAYTAITKADAERKKLHLFIKTIFNFANLSGYRIKGDWWIENRFTNETIWYSKSENKGNN